MREKITEALVYRLADELVALGENPTNGKIRQRNGDYGSPNDIQPILKRWKAEQFQRDQQRKQSQQKPMPGHLEELFKPMWDALCLESMKELEELRLAFEEQLKEKDSEIYELGELLRQADDAKKVNDQERELLKAELEQERNNNNELNQQIINHQNTIHHLELDIIDSKKELETAEMQRDRNSELVKELRDKISASQNNYHEIKGQLSEKDRQLEALKGQLEKAIDENKNLVSELAAEKARASDLNIELEQYSDQIIDLQKQITQSETRLEAAQNEIENLGGYRDLSAITEGKVIQLEKQIEQLNSRLDTMISPAHHREKLQRIAELEADLAIKQQTIDAKPKASRARKPKKEAVN